jgi:E3 ubiquitin-protein ligase TRIP12
MLDSRIIDISFNPTFFRINDGSSTAVVPSLGAIKTVDEGLASSLLLLKQFADAKKKVEDSDLSPEEKAVALQEIVIHDCTVEDLALDFTLPGYDSIELIENGANTAVTIENVDLYVDKVIDFTLGSGVERQANAFREGFTEVFPYSALKAFTPDELVMLFGRTDEDWSLESKFRLSLHCAIMLTIPQHWWTRSRQITATISMSQFNAQERRDFLQFITGSPKLPIGGRINLNILQDHSHANLFAGFKALTPMFTVVCKPSEPPFTSDDYLPSVMTCVNYLKMPDYSSVEILREKLSVAIREGQGAFHLS